MKISVIGSTKSGYQATKREFDIAGGHSAGICYMAYDFDTIQNEPVEKTDRRIAQTKGGGHHSVYDHTSISFYFEDIPKGLAMLLNNERMYTTSEKSARYTKMVLSEQEQVLYDKWIEIYAKQIRDTYGAKYPERFNYRKITKLAQENARYLTSVLTPTSMKYTVSYRQLNYLYGFFRDEIDRKENNTFMRLIKPAMKEFCDALDKTDYIDPSLRDNKGRRLSLITEAPVETYYGDVYATTYKGSYAQYAQAQRHRSLSYSIAELPEPEFYIPPIIRTDDDLAKEWIEDCKSLTTVLPQGMLVEITEMGTLDNFILKMKERKCGEAQLEINQQTNETLKQYLQALRDRKHMLSDKNAGKVDNNTQLKSVQNKIDKLEPYTKGARCVAGFKCTQPCGFPEGVKETRLI